MQLSIRMQAVADMVTPGGKVADVGTDHGYVPIYLIEQNKAFHAIAMDVRKGPLARAGENIVRFGCSGRIETRLSDGLERLEPNEADTVIIAGMGGLLTVRILEAGLEVLKTVKECVLQPQSDLDKVRQFLHQHHFCIVQEKMLIDEGKYYTVMRVVHGEESPYTEAEDLYGRHLIDDKSPVLAKYLAGQKNVKEKLLEALYSKDSEKSLKRQQELLHELQMINDTIARLVDENAEQRAD